MSTRVVGYRPPDAKWKAMKKVWDACEEAGTPIPKEVDAFFESDPPTSAGVEVDIRKAVSIPALRDMVETYEVDITKLPKDVTIVRFENRY